MSKKSIFYPGHGRGNSLSKIEAQGEQPVLYARKQSSAKPFIISSSDNPYEKAAGGSSSSLSAEYISSSRHARSSSRAANSARPTRTLNRLLSAVGVTKVQRHTTTRNRRIAVFGLIACMVFLLNHYQSFGSRYLSTDISKPFATARKLLTPASFAAGGLSARNDHETAAPGQARQPAGHTFHPNGLLLVNPQGPHPIHSLIDHAEKRWKNLLDKQSKSLEEAASEYKRRYKRNPPAGFDAWYVQYLLHPLEEPRLNLALLPVSQVEVRKNE